MSYGRNRPVLDLEDHATIRYSHCNKSWKQSLQAVTQVWVNTTLALSALSADN